MLSTAAAGRSVDRGRASHVRLRSRYETHAAVQRVLDSHASDLLDRLEAADLLPTADVSELDAFATDSDAVADADAVEVMSTVDHRTGVETAVVRVTQRTEDADLDLFVLPEAGRSYATVDQRGGGKFLISDSDDEADDEVSTMVDEHQYHGDWEFQYTTTECTSDNCTGGHNDCNSDHWMLTCSWNFYTEEVYEVYECGKVDLYPDGSTEECSATKKELASTNCSDNCCSQDGPGCSYCGEC